jgi:hypothetical protein
VTWEPDYASVAELKGLLRIPDTEDDAELALALSAASRVIDRATSRQFGQVDTAEARTFELSWSRQRGRWKARIDDLMTDDDLEVVAGGATLATSAYQFRRHRHGHPWVQLLVDRVTSPTAGYGPSTVEVTALWGWAEVPAAIKQATLIQASRIFKRRDSPFGVAGSPQVGSELRLLAKVDADVEVLVKPYRRDHPLI